MYGFGTRNATGTLHQGLLLMDGHGVERDNVLWSDSPVSVLVSNVAERLVDSEFLLYNPFDLLFRSLWFLAGRNDVAYVKKFDPSAGARSDDGSIIWGALGWRARGYFGHDQIEWVISALKADPFTEHGIMQFWDGNQDPHVLSQGGKSVPHSNHVIFRKGKGTNLNMVVTNHRSSPLDLLGFVQMSFLHEYVATSAGLTVGDAWFNSSSYALPKSENLEFLIGEARDFSTEPDWYRTGAVRSRPLMNGVDFKSTWDQDLLMFLDEPLAVGFRNAFFRKVAKPMFAAWVAYADNDIQAALDNLAQMEDGDDWKTASILFLERVGKESS